MTSRLSSLLVQDGLVSARRMADAFQRQVIYGGSLDTNLLEMRLIEEDVLLTYLGRAAGLPTQPGGIQAMGRPAKELIEGFGRELAERYRAVPTGGGEEGVLRVLTADPVEPRELEALALKLKRRIEPWIAPEFRLMEAMQDVFADELPSRYARLLARSRQAHEQKGVPPCRLIDPVPRFGGLHVEPGAHGIPESAIARLMDIAREDAPAGRAESARRGEARPSGQAQRAKPAEEAESPRSKEGGREHPPLIVPESAVIEEVPAETVQREVLKRIEVVPQKPVSAPPPPPRRTPPVIVDDAEWMRAADELVSAIAVQESARQPGPAPVPEPISEKSAPPVPVQAPKAPKGRALQAAPVQPVQSGGKGKKKRRKGEAPRVPPPAPVVARPVITPPQQPRAQDLSAPAPPPQAAAPPKVLVEPALAATELSAVPSRLTQEHTPLPTPVPPPSDYSGPNASLVSGLHGVLPESAPPEPVPVPIDSGRLGERIVYTKSGLTVAPPAAEIARPAASFGEALSFTAAQQLVVEAQERDLIFEALCRAARGRVAFAAVFTVHGDVAFGRMALGKEWLDRHALGKVAIPLDRPSAFRIAAKGRSPYVGRLGEQPAVGEPLSSLGRSVPLEGAVLPVLVRGRPLALLYLDDDGRALEGSLVEDLRPLMLEVSQAFQRLVLRGRAGKWGVEDVSGPRGERRVEDDLASGTSSWGRQDSGERSSTPMRVSAEGVSGRAAAAGTEQIAARIEETSGEKHRTEPFVRKEPAVVIPITSREAPRPASGAAARRASNARSRDAAPAEGAPPPLINPQGTYAEMLAGAEKGEEAAVERLLGGGAAAARALVMALPGPLKSRERQALGDPIGEPVFSRGPLLALVPRMGRAVVEPLIERLDNPVTPPEVRYYLALCFTELPLQQAAPVLGRRLYDKDPAVRMAAVTALRSFPASPDLRDIKEMLRSDLLGPDAERQIDAIEALGELRDVQAVPRLIQLISHKDLSVAAAAERALASITKQEFGRSRFRWRLWWRRHGDETRLQWMLRGLLHMSASVRASAQDELRGLCGDPVGYRFDGSRRERELAQRRWAEWWQRRGYSVHAGA